MDDDEDEVTDMKLQIFHNTVREHIVSDIYFNWFKLTIFVDIHFIYSRHNYFILVPIVVQSIAITPTIVISTDIGSPIPMHFNEVPLKETSQCCDYKVQ